MGKALIKTIILSIVIIGIVHLQPIWERHPGGFWNILFYLLIPILFIWINIKIIVELFRIFKKRKSITLNSFLPLIVLFITLLDVYYNPLNIDLDKIYGKILFRACYEGTQNQATFKLRQGNRFELHWTGVFFYDEFFTGKYTQKGDTLILNYSGEQPVRFGDKILMDNKNQQLIPIRRDNDSLINAMPFYYGYCKGLN